MELFPFTPHGLESWMVIGVVAGAVLGGLFFLGGIGGYILAAARRRPPHKDAGR